MDEDLKWLLITNAVVGVIVVLNVWDLRESRRHGGPDWIIKFRLTGSSLLLACCIIWRD